jgi:hypothetical protein
MVFGYSVDEDLTPIDKDREYSGNDKTYLYTTNY